MIVIDNIKSNIEKDFLIINKILNYILIELLIYQTKNF